MSETTHNSAIVHASEETFDALVLKSARPVLVKFGAEWCPPCRMMEPFLEVFARLWAGQADVVEVNTDHSKNLKATYGVQGIPHVIVIKAGEVVAVEQSEEKYGGIGLPDYATLRSFASELLFGTVSELSPAETAFAAAAQSADEARDKTITESPAYAAWNAAWEPHAAEYQSAVESADAALAAKSIDEAEYELLIAAARQKNGEAFKTESVQAAYTAYKELTGSTEAQWKTAVLAAVEEFFPQTAPATAHASGTTTGGTGSCAIGDKSCNG
jgi:thioredoxin 1